MELKYEIIGEGDNLLVLIHPFPVNSHYFDKIKNNILPLGWKLCLPDLPGFGSTPNDMGKEIWKMEDFAYQINNLVKKIHHEKLVIGGVSMGGYITMAFAKVFPGKAQAYILSNTNDEADADGGAGRLEVVKNILRGDKDLFLKNLLNDRLVGATTLVSRKHLLDEINIMFEKTTSFAIIQTMRGMGQRTDSRLFFSKIEEPILIIAGNEDALIPIEVAKSMTMIYPKGELAIINDTGHYSAMESPESYSKSIKGFLAKL